jgi:hypothetical protein
VLDLLPLVLGLPVVGAALIAALRARERRRLASTRADRASENATTFRLACADIGVSGTVADVVYDFFARENTPVEIAPRLTDRLWKEQGIDYPEELADVLTTLVGRIGAAGIVEPAEISGLRTVGDVATWLQSRSALPRRPA